MTRLVDILSPIPGDRAVAAISELAETAQSVSWITRWRDETVDAAATVGALGLAQGRLGPEMQRPMTRLREALDLTARQEFT